MAGIFIFKLFFRNTTNILLNLLLICNQTYLIFFWPQGYIVKGKITIKFTRQKSLPVRNGEALYKNFIR